MHIDQLLASVSEQKDNSKVTLSVEKSWTQGRTLFGGISASLLYQAARDRVKDDRVLRSLNTNFIGPLEADTPFDIEVEVLREGRNATQAVAKAIQNGNICVMAQACFGVGRESKIRVDRKDTHEMSIPKKPKFIPQIPKVTPKFLKHLDLALTDGSMPFTGSKNAHVHGWMRFTNAPERITDAHLVALIDAWPPAVLQMMRWPAPASTMSWNIEFIHPHTPVGPTEWFAYKAETRQAAEGYAHTEANIWDDKGELVAISRQAVAIFD